MSQNQLSCISLSTPPNPVKGHVTIPGSKSYTNRALIMAALTSGECQILSASQSDDSVAMVSALKKLGITINDQGQTISLSGTGAKTNAWKGEIDVGPAGTTMRFLTAFFAGIPGADIMLSGSERMHQRPIHDLVNALISLGAKIDYLGKQGCPPLRIHSEKHLTGGTVKVNGNISSQFITALLLISPLFEKGLRVEIVGEQISKSYIDMTIDGMKEFGIEVRNDNYQSYTVAPGSTYKARTYQVEGDASGASYLWSLAALSNGCVRVCNVNPYSAQGDMIFPSILEKMGCRVERSKESQNGWVEVQGCAKLQPIEVDMELLPDTAQTLAVICSIAQGTSKITGLSTLRIKETDRLQALLNELGKCGIKTEIGADFIIVHGGTPHAARIATYEDHRMAMSFAGLASIVKGIEIEHPNVVNKSFPDFWQKYEALGIPYQSCA